MAHEKIVTMFSNIADAEGAKRSLLKAGFDDSDIDIISGDRLQKEGHEAHHPGLWQRLFGDTLDEAQASVYDDALNSGGVVLTLRAEEEQLPRALSIIDMHDTGKLSQNDVSGFRESNEAVSSAGLPADEIYTGKPQLTKTTPEKTSLTGDEAKDVEQDKTQAGKASDDLTIQKNKFDEKF
ncbi:hypothetical protein O3W44_24410 [Pantoea sp. LMR881]|uniref:hypothetical protein n=1 Tax=Pantoea sp. LMR881 TaxID=3014336 RepID=UPI0022AF2222|nr:hypothetical protein [Pantoea sp. LMR881]MCZ4061608.1 hypothetical protein [Pantoea sp. LMR881]